jgi:RHS repeat-associated protein
MKQFIRGAALACMASAAVANVNNTAVGTLPGDVTVTKSGAANYHIPIEVPPGVNGLQPNLALVYDSQKRNGLLGIGWKLTGISSISRCPTTLVQDGFIDGVDFDDNDKFCLNGDRLVAVGGTYGAHGTEYRTEYESYRKIISYGSAGNGPAYFKVWYKDGRIAEFGNTDNSRVEAQGKTEALSWAINKISDRFNNEINFNYSENNATGEHYPASINYAGTTVEFNFENRPDNMFGYVAGTQYQTAKRLKKIAVKQGAQHRFYSLNYKTTAPPKQSLVKSIQLCSKHCQPLTHFQWHHTNPANDFSQSQLTLSQFGSVVGQWKTDKHIRKLEDINGDGLADIIGFGNDGVYVSYNSSNGFSSIKLALRQFGSEAGKWHINQHPRVLGDINGDGLKDIIGFGNSGVYVSYNTGSGFGPVELTLTKFGSKAGQWAPGQHPRMLGDVNGDGLIDIIGFGDKGVHVSFSNGQGFTEPKLVISEFGQVVGGWRVNEHPRMLGDVNGDGLTDIIGFGDQGVYVAYSTGDGYTNPERVLNQFGRISGKWSPDKHPRMLGDVNGDGLIDIIGFGDKGVHVSFSNGQGFTEPKLVISEFGQVGGWRVNEHPRMLGDVNGDGLTDIIGFGNQGVYVAYSTGDGYTNPERVLNQFGHTSGKWSPDEHPRMLGDVNGDGLIDIIGFGNQGVYTSRSQFQKPLIYRITNGLGHLTKLTYSPLTNQAIFTKSSGSQYPVKDSQPTTYTVTQVQKDSGVGSFTTSRYQYEGLKFHQQGLGSLGFAKVTSTQVDTGIQTINEYAQDAHSRQIGLLTHSQVIAKNGAVLKDTQQTWSVTPLAASYVNRYLTHLNTLTTVQRSLENTWLSSSTQTLKIDGYGNVTEKQVATTGLYNNYWQIVKNQYENNENSWLIGLPTRTQDSRSTKLAPALTRTQSFQYDYVTGALKQSVIEPDNGDLILTNAYTYDSFGNPQTITQSGAKIETTTTQLAYTDDGRFLKSTTNALGHVSSQTVDPFWGVTLTTTDANNQVVSYQYDDFGRLNTETRPDGTTTTVTRGWFQGQAKDPKKYWVTTQSSGSSPSTVYFDKLGRNVETQTIALTGQTTLVKTVYNSLGQVEAQSFPHFAGEKARWTQYQYDELLRPTQVTRPDASVSTTAYNGLTTVVTNALNQTKTTQQNALGQVVQVIDDAGSTLQYQYNAFGNLTQTIDPLNNITTISYDVLGRKTGMDDPDKGKWAYEYDALDRLVLQTDAKGQQTKLAYDKLDRLIKRIDNAQADKKDWKISLWEYDTSYKGLLEKTESEYFKRQYRYDSLLRLTHTTQQSYRETFTVETQYDALSRPEKTIYPTGLTVAQQYNQHGYLTAITDGKAQNPKTYWEATAVDPFGNVSASTQGNGVETIRMVNPKTGRIETIFTSMSSANIADLNFQYDDLGNLKSREDKQLNVKETFEYDQLNRLTDVLATFSDGKTHSTQVKYDVIGNIEFKSDVGDYSYGGSCDNVTAGPHAVTKTSGTQNTQYCYDKNGNMVSGNNRTIQYTAFDKPDLINNHKNGASTAFTYGTDRARHRRVDTTSSADLTESNTTYYMGGIYEKVISHHGKVQHKHYIADVAIVTQTENAGSENGTKTNYLHRDHLDSIVAITDENAQVIERFSYDPWGKKRQTDWKPAQDYTTLASSITTRGFTNHENLDAVGLIHANGRVYDPNLGRFLSADPIVQSPYNLQSYNRYSYAWNNPLNGIDPSGFTLIGPGFDDKNDGFGGDFGSNNNDFGSNDFNGNDYDNGGGWGDRNDLDDRIGIDFDNMFDSRPSETDISSHVNNAGGYDNVADYAAENGNHDGILSDLPEEVMRLGEGVPPGEQGPFLKAADKIKNFLGHLHPKKVGQKLIGSIVKGLGALKSKAKSLVSSLTSNVARWSVPKSVTKKLPSNWSSKPNKKGIGTRWQDPNNPGNGVRIDKGNPNHSLSSQKVDHVVVRRNGKVIGRDGKAIQGSVKNNAEQAHIPLSEYKSWNSWDSPL